MALTSFMRRFGGAERDGERLGSARFNQIDLEEGASMKTTLLMLLFVAVTGSAWASSHHAYRTSDHARWSEPSITCETVRAYVSQMGVAQARAMARANGMTAEQERRARQCLTRRS